MRVVSLDWVICSHRQHLEVLAHPNKLHFAQIMAGQVLGHTVGKGELQFSKRSDILVNTFSDATGLGSFLKTYTDNMKNMVDGMQIYVDFKYQREYCESMELFYRCLGFIENHAAERNIGEGSE